MRGTMPALVLPPRDPRGGPAVARSHPGGRQQSSRHLPQPDPVAKSTMLALLRPPPIVHERLPAVLASIAGRDVQVRTMASIVQNRTTLIETARAAALALIEREEKRVGSRMAAYAAVAQMVGVSDHWLRKFVCGYADAKVPDFVIGMNILHVYARLTMRGEP